MPRRLVDQFVYQKNLALERAGVDLYGRAPMSPEKVWNLYGDAMTKMAAIVEAWGTDPGVTMEACFAYSRSKRHMDGPQLNMLGSAKYLLSAIAYHLELPRDAAADMVSKESMVKQLAKEALAYEAQLRKHLTQRHGSDDPWVLHTDAGALDMSMVTSVPALYRFLLCPIRHPEPPDFAVKPNPLGLLLIPEILGTLRVNAKQRLWANHLGWTYRGLAGYYHIIQPRPETT